MLLLLLALIVLICTEYQDILGQDEVTDPVDYKAVLDWRVSRLRHVCRHLKNQMAAEHSSLYHRHQKLNKCTTSYFTIKGTNHIICNILKGGSTSWNVFFGEDSSSEATYGKAIVHLDASFQEWWLEIS